MEQWQLEDLLQSILAQTHAIQNRCLQCASRGEMSPNIKDEVIRRLEGMAKRLRDSEIAHLSDIGRDGTH